MGCIFRTNGNGVLTLCIVVITSCKRTCTSSISIYTHSRCTCTCSARIVTNYCRVFPSLFWCCFPGTFCIVNVVIRTNSNSRLSICITYVTYGQGSRTRSVITSTNSCSSTACSRISITYCSSCVICRCIFSTNSYFSVMSSYIICSILVAYNDGVLSSIIFTIASVWSSVRPNINVAITSIITSLCF